MDEEFTDGLVCNTLAIEFQLYFNLDKTVVSQLKDHYGVSLGYEKINHTLGYYSQTLYTAWSWRKSREEKYQLLNSSVNYGHLEVVKVLTENCTGVFRNYRILISQACYCGHLEIFQYLCEFFQPPKYHSHTYADFNDFLAMTCACSYCQPEFIKYLLDLSTEFDRALYNICGRGHLNHRSEPCLGCVKLVIHAIKNRKTNFEVRHFREALSNASLNGHLDIVEFLIAEFRNYF